MGLLEFLTALAAGKALYTFFPMEGYGPPPEEEEPPDEDDDGYVPPPLPPGWPPGIIPI